MIHVSKYDRSASYGAFCSLIPFIISLIFSSPLGIMTVEEVRHMIEVIYRESDQKNLTVLNVLIDNIGKCEIVSIDDFVVLVRNLPSLLYPVFDLIKAVRQRTLGEKRWIEISKLRMLPLANKFVFMNKVNSGNISLSKLNSRVKSSSSLHHRNGSFNSVGSANRNGNLRYSITGGELLQSASEGSVNGGNLTGRSNNREDDSSSSSSLYPKQIRRRNSANGSDMSASPSKMRAHSFSATGNGSMGALSHRDASSSATVYNAASNLRRNGSGVQRVSYSGAPRDRDQDSQKSNSLSSSAADSTPKTNLDAIKVANALHLDRMKRANSQNLNKLIEANSTLDAYKKKSVCLHDTAQSNSSDSSPDISEVTARKVESKCANREGVFTSARRFSK